MKGANAIDGVNLSKIYKIKKESRETIDEDIKMEENVTVLNDSSELNAEDLTYLSKYFNADLLYLKVEGSDTMVRIIENQKESGINFIEISCNFGDQGVEKSYNLEFVENFKIERDFSTIEISISLLRRTKTKR